MKISVGGAVLFRESFLCVCVRVHVYLHILILEGINFLIFRIVAAVQ
jgi:hypothetical protein